MILSTLIAVVALLWIVPGLRGRHDPDHPVRRVTAGELADRGADRARGGR